MIDSEKENYLHFFQSKDGKLSMSRRLGIRVFQERYLGSIKLEVVDEDINALSYTQKMEN